jgi:hypothetical protein
MLTIEENSNGRIHPMFSMAMIATPDPLTPMDEPLEIPEQTVSMACSIFSHPIADVLSVGHRADYVTIVNLFNHWSILDSMRTHIDQRDRFAHQFGS